jgi:hypothetical protein
MEAIHDEGPVPNFVHEVACLGTIPGCLENLKNISSGTYLVLTKKRQINHYNDLDSPLELNLSNILTSKPNSPLLILGLRISKDA